MKNLNGSFGTRNITVYGIRVLINDIYIETMYRRGYPSKYVIFLQDTTMTYINIRYRHNGCEFNLGQYWLQGSKVMGLYLKLATVNTLVW